MANEKNLIPFTGEQSREEAKKNGKKGGKASGAARRRKANFRRVLSSILSAEVEVEDISPMLAELGIESTIEAAVNMAMVKQALEGNVKAYVAIRESLGQSTKTELDEREQRARIKAAKEDNSTGSEVNIIDDL